jgi:hypothetical protein
VPGSGGGYYFSFSLPELTLQHAWRAVDGGSVDEGSVDGDSVLR